MPKGRRRDIYKGRFDEGFDINRDIDLAHLRSIMQMDKPSNEDLNYYGLYVYNIIKILLNGSNFRGYKDDVKEDMTGEALIDMTKARTKFDGAEHPEPSAPFNYLFRVGFHSFQHVLNTYYRMQNRMIPASQVGKGIRIADSSKEFTDDILEKAVNDWDAIADNLRTTEAP